MHPDARAAAEWARDALADPATVILDTETTGLGPLDEVIEFAIINPKGGTLYNSRFWTAFLISPGAEAVHGISLLDLQKEPPFATQWDKIQGLLRGKRVVTYNAGFDIQMIRQTLAHYRLNYSEMVSDLWACAMLQFAAFHGDWNRNRGSYRWLTLNTAASEAGYVEDNAHSALGDALTTLAVLRYMAASLDPPTVQRQGFGQVPAHEEFDA